MPRFRTAAVLSFVGLLVANSTCAAVELLVADNVLINDIEAVDIAVAAPAGGAAGQLEQFRAQLEPMLKVELSFAVRASAATPAERDALVAAGKKWFEEFLPNYVKKAGPAANRQMIIFNGGRVGAQAAAGNPRETIAKGVADAVKKSLPAEKAARYNEECGLREDFARRAAVENVVARVDEQILLSPEQRTKITEALDKHWDKNWVPQMELFMMNANMWPRVPDRWIRAELTPAQRTVWDRLRKNPQHMVWGGGIAFGGGQQVIDDIELPAEEKPAAEEKSP